jgi:HAD superfamily hydrolase (TIGR01509 family)
MVKGLLFDHDGVLIDSEASQIRAWKEFFRAYGKTFDDRKLHLMTRGRTARDIITHVFTGETTARIRALADERESLHFSILRQELRPVSGIAHFLMQVKRRGFKLAVGTAARSQKLHYALETLGLDGFFDAFVTAEDYGIGKPEPEVFLLAAKRLGIPPEECMVFEDSFNGVEAARRAGMKAVVLTTSHLKHEFESGNIVGFFPDFRNSGAIFSLIAEN